MKAAESGTSGSALVADYLRTLSAADARFATLADQQRAVQNEITRFTARDRLDRDDVHDRAVH